MVFFVIFKVKKTMQEKEMLEKLVSESSSLSEVLKKQGKSISGSSFKILKNNLDNYDIKYHFLNKKGSKYIFRNKPLTDILIENSNYSSSDLKKRLIKEGLKNDICEICGQSNVWNNNTLTLQLHHIDGNHNNNCLTNLSIICPNCHTQMTSYLSKKNKKEKFCIDCNRKIWTTSTRCNRCARIYHSKHKVDIKLLPTKKELEQMIFTIPFTKIGKMYGVSDSCIRKWCKKEGLPFTKKEIRKLIKTNISI